MLDLAAAVGHIPAAPSSSGVSNCSGQACLDWTDNSHSEHGFELMRQTKIGGVWTNDTFISLPMNGDSSGTATDSPGAGEHRYRLRSTNSIGESAWSNTVQITL